MKLFHKILGEGSPIIIAHGLYGSSDNWISIAKELAQKHQVILVDLRNHGQSPHSNSHSYSDLADDLFELFNKLNLNQATLLGHSMGGKAAMQFAVNHPHMLTALVVVDIAPKSYADASGYSPHAKEHLAILSALRDLPLSTITSRSDADEWLSHKIQPLSVRQFLLKNLDRDENNKFIWKLNLDALWQKLPALMSGIKTPENFTPITNLPVLIIKGELSPYIDKEEDLPLFQKLFVASEIITIEDTGHWVHAEKPKQVIAAIENFLER